jgi:hypothetical protein
LRNTNPKERLDLGWGWWIVFVGEVGPYASKTDEKNQQKSQLGTRSKVKYFHQEKDPQHFEQWYYVLITRWIRASTVGQTLDEKLRIEK